jgi:hypothetical protein
MGINMRNAEGYYDPTAYAALSRIASEERKANYRPLVYICSPYSGDIENNVVNARIYCKYAVANHCIPIAPHLFFPQFMDDDTERELAMFMDLVLLSKCEELWVFGNVISKGMGQEIEKAERKNMKIRYFSHEVLEV